jgi:prepilin-type N-terminal cleavage/methylation domain-containing protein
MKSYFETKEKPGQKGFSIIEVLVVIAIIAVLAGVVMVNLQRARVRGRVGKAEGDLGQLRTAIGLLQSDTGKLSNGCPPTESNDTTVEMQTPEAGIVEMPPVGLISGTCEWTDGDVSQWKGPYSDISKDPWNRYYVFDSQYIITCEAGTPTAAAVIMTLGEDGVATEPYNGSCVEQTTDDMYVLLK